MNQIPELDELARNVGKFLEYWGFKNVHGQIWLHIFLSKSPLTASELITRLGVSKALVSVTLKDLVDYKVITEFGKGAKGTMLYTANPNVLESIMNVLRRREQPLIGHIQTSFQLFKKVPKKELQSLELDPERMRALAALIANAQSMLASFIALNDVKMDMWKLDSSQNP